MASNATRPWTLVLPSVAGAEILAAGAWFFSNPEQLTSDVAVSRLADFAGSLLLLCIFTGICSMASVEFAIRMFSLRGRYHRAALHRLVGRDVVDRLTSGVAGDDARRFDVPVGVLMAQLNALVDDVATATNQRLRPVSPVVKRLLGFGDDTEVAAYEVTDVQVNASIDNVQTVLAAGWTRQVQAWSCVVSGGIGLVFLLILEAGAAAKFTSLLGTLVIGGYFAWLARDLTALVERKQ